jgi:hypothetical protein
MNMKYKYILTLATGFLLGLAGCKKDFLETKIDTFKTPEAAATDRATLFSFGNAFYTSLQYGFTAIDNNLFAAVSDEAQQTAAVSNATIFNQGGLNANINPDGGLYKTYYEGIRAANFFLDYSNNARALLSLNRDTVSDVVNYKNDLQNVAWYRAEAHVARAYYYSELIKRYGGVPIINTTLQQTSTQYVGKSSYDAVVAFIVSEIDTYKPALQVNWKTSSFSGNDGRFTLGSALAIKARVLLYAASPLHNPSNDVTKWQAAAAAAKDVMTTTGLNYVLDGNYRNYFLGANSLSSNETIFAVRRPANNTPETANYPIGTPGGNSGVTPTENLVADYEYIGAAVATDPYANRDPRLAASVVTNNSTWNNRTINESAGGVDDMANANTSKTGYYLKKFLTDGLNLVQGGTAQNQWVLYRYGEILLNYAEAMNEAYGPDATPAGYTVTARQALNLVRNRASNLLPAVTAATIPTFRAVLKHERKIELAFEDHRYWDLLRWKDAETVLNQPIKGVKVIKSGANFVYTTVNVATRVFSAPANYYYPFAQAEIANSNGTLVQNPGY